MTPSEIKLFKQYREEALNSQDLYLYYHNEFQEEWCSFDEKFQMMEDGFVVEYIEDNVKVLHADGEEQQERIESHIVRHYYSFDNIKTFKLVRVIPKADDNLKERLNKLL